MYIITENACYMYKNTNNTIYNFVDKNSRVVPLKIKNRIQILL